MSSTKEKIKAVTEEIEEKAEHYAAVGNYQQLVQNVMQIGAKSMMARNFTLEQAKQVSAMMIAAIALAQSN